MYSWIWNKLPGTLWLKLLLVLILIATASAAMFFLLFPFLDTVVFPELEPIPQN